MTGVVSNFFIFWRKLFSLVHFFSFGMLGMADVRPNGPPQRGRGVNGQYVYWITMSHPTVETVQSLGVKTPAEFTRESFAELIVQAHKSCSINIVAPAILLELHANGNPHLNCHVRAEVPFRWLPVGNRLVSRKRHLEL